MQKKDFNVLELFCKLCSSFNAQNHLFRASRHTNAVLVQKITNEENESPKSFFLGERKLVNAILGVKLEYIEDVYFS